MPTAPGALSATHYTGDHGQHGRTASADFGRRLAQAEAPGATAIMDAAYWIAWPGCTVARTLSRHTAQQAQGCDAVVTLPDGRAVTVEEKWRPDRTHIDVALEYMHLYDDGRVKPGWIHTYPDTLDWVAYACGRSSVVILMPWPELCDAYRRMGPDWIRMAAAEEYRYLQDDQYRRQRRITEAHNDVGYMSRCVTVPLGELRREVPGIRVIPVGNALRGPVATPRTRRAS